MNIMIRAFKRHLHEATTGIHRHLAMSISAASAVTVTLILMSILLIVIVNISQITVNLQESVKIFVKIDEDIEDTAIYTLKKKVEAIDGVASVEYSSKDEELDKLEEEFGDSGEMFEVYRDNNPLSRAFIVEVKQNYKIADVSSAIGTISGISEATFGGATTEQFMSTLTSIRNGGAIIILALSLLAIFLVSNTIKITIYARQEEIAIMRYVGATNNYIRAPFVMEGVFIGILGSIIPIIFTIFGYNLVYEAMGGKLITGILTLLPVFPFSLWISLILLGMGIIVGFLGSLFSVNRNLRWKR